MKKLLLLLLLLSIFLSGCGAFQKNTKDSDSTLETEKLSNELDDLLNDLDTLEFNIDEIADDELIQP